jgi:capsular exopolysaccharide synthesis family protein
VFGLCDISPVEETMTGESGTDLTLRSYARIMRRRKWWVIGLALGGLAVSLLFSFIEPRQYTATAQVLVQAPTGAVSLGSVPQQVTPTQVQTMLLLVSSASVKRQVSQSLGSAPAVSAAEAAQTNVINITATSRAPARAALIANTYARAFISSQRNVTVSSLASAEAQVRAQIRSVGKQIRALRGTGTASQQAALINQQAVLKEQLAQMQVNGTAAADALALVTPAQPPTSPSSPRPARNGLLGLVAGLVLGVGAAFLRENLDDAVGSKEEAEHLAGAPVLAAVPLVRSWKKRDKPLVVSLARPTSPAAEAYRSLRTSLQFARQERELRTLLVTSPAAAEGKTSTLSNLGAVFAQAGERVLMVSCDLRKPRLGEFFGVDESQGVTTAILGEQSVEQLLRPVPGSKQLWMLGSGPAPPNPAELLGAMRIQEVLAMLRGMFDLVLIDSPPVLPVTDAVVLSKDADATLLVVAAGQTSRGDVQRAAEKLAQVEARVLGVVLNEVTRQGGGYGYGYRYGYGSYRAYGSQVAAMDSAGNASMVTTQMNGAGKVVESNRPAAQRSRHARRFG